MIAPDEDASADARARRLYALVVICEIAVVAALWAFGRAYA
jgi:hypothetical protein